jgi:hypothetical protein
MGGGLVGGANLQRSAERRQPAQRCENFCDDPSLEPPTSSPESLAIAPVDRSACLCHSERSGEVEESQASGWRDREGLVGARST